MQRSQEATAFDVLCSNVQTSMIGLNNSIHEVGDIIIIAKNRNFMLYVHFYPTKFLAFKDELLKVGQVYV